MSQGANDIAEECGYNSAVEMIMDSLTEEEMKEMLREYLHNDDTLYDIAHEIASQQHEYVDWEQVKSDAEDAAYQAFRDRMYDDDDMVGC